MASNRLIKIGLRPISGLVDLTNFLTFDSARPLHAFDADRLEGDLVVRKAKDGEEYILNLIDTPGHVDFSYEVSRSMRAVEGSLLVVDASQGVEAQTLANVYQALEINHEVIPVLNKIDLPASDIEKTKKELSSDSEIKDFLDEFDGEIEVVTKIKN